MTRFEIAGAGLGVVSVLGYLFWESSGWWLLAYQSLAGAAVVLSAVGQYRRSRS